MRSGYVSYIFRITIFYLLLFVTGRFLFLLYNHSLAGRFSIEWLGAFTHAVRLDMSFVAYLAIFPVLCFIIFMIAQPRWLQKILYGYVLITFLLIAIIQSCDMVLYREWMSKLNYKALSFLEHPGEIIRTASFLQIGTVIGITLLQVLILLPFGKRWFMHIIDFKNKGLWLNILFLLVINGMLILFIRGGFQPIPINLSDTYFSENQVLNDAAVNTSWNLAQSISENYSTMRNKPFRYFSDEEAKAIVDSLYDFRKDTSASALNTERPNIVMVILESWSAEVVHSLGGLDSLTPEFDKLSAEGLSFTHIYAPGWRSDMGMPAIHSGFPATPYHSIVTQPAKYHALPSLNKTLQKVGYNSSFLFGGQLAYGNIKSYIYFNQFDVIREGSDLPDEMPHGHLGVHDEGLYKEGIHQTSRLKHPFFSVLYTLSSHPPYDMPMKTKFNWGGNEQEYINSIYYSDKCLGDFIREAKKQSWYHNTLFVFVADHGHGSPNVHETFSPEIHRIPLMFYGDVIKPEWKGKQIDKVGSQVDLPATLLPQLGLKADDFKWSKDLLNPYSPGFASFVFVLGYAWVNEHGYYDWEMHYKKNNRNQFDSKEAEEKATRQSKAFMQYLYNEYDSY